MISLSLLTPYDTLVQIAKRASEKRLELNFSQKTLSERSGVSLGVLKKFERTGKISLESLLKLALVLDSLEGFAEVFPPKPLKSYVSLEQALKKKNRRRGRQ